MTQPHLHERVPPTLNSGVFVSCTCQVLLYTRLLLQEFGPSHGPSVEDSHVLVHHLLIGLKILMSLEAVGVNPAGANPHSPVPCTDK